MLAATLCARDAQSSGCITTRGSSSSLHFVVVIIVVIVSDGSKFFLEKQKKKPGTLESAAEERNYFKYTKYNMLLFKKCWFLIIIRYYIRSAA